MFRTVLGSSGGIRSVRHLSASVASGSTNSIPRVAIIGSGNFGTTMARRIALNRAEQYPRDNQEIKMWVFEELFDGRLLTEVINTDRVNAKYLPNVLLPATIRACPDIKETCFDADILVFIVSHQHLGPILKDMQGHVKPSAIGVSLIKGVDFSETGPKLLSDQIKNELGLEHSAVMMGANIASDIAYDKYVEATVAAVDPSVASRVSRLFNSALFRTEISNDVSTVEFCGALKNVVAVGAGLCDGMSLGASTKAALMRQGLAEMTLFCKIFDTTGNHSPSTMLQSCGIADLIATCSGGRNRLCSATFAKRVIADSEESFLGGRNSHHRDRDSSRDYTREEALLQQKLPPELCLPVIRSSVPSGIPSAKDGWQSREDAASELWNEIEAELLRGQKLQGVDMCKEVVRCLQASSAALEEYLLRNNCNTDGGGGLSAQQRLFPLIHRIHRIAVEGEDLNQLLDWPQ